MSTNDKWTLFTVFSTFDMDQLGKIRRHHWKERLNISNNAKFESDTSQAIEDIASQSCETLLRLYGGGRGVGASLCRLPYKRR